jgi:hypothetical protein
LKTDYAIYKLTTEILSAMNNKLLVGGIFFCDLEKAFDCVDHNTRSSKLKFNAISGMDLALYQSYFYNRYFRTQYIVTVITLIKFQAGPKLGMKSHKALLYDLYVSTMYKLLTQDNK